MQVYWPGLWLRSSVLVLWASVAAAIPARAQTPAVTLAPAEVEAGSPELIRVAAPAGATLEGEWLGEKLAFFRGRDGQARYALTGVDVEGAVGPSILRIRVVPEDGGGTATPKPIDLSRSIEIHEAHYRTGTLTVAPKFVAPGPEALKRIEAEIELKKRVFAESAPQPLWSGDFRAPVDAPPTDSFGTRRVFNGQLASVHKGMDFRAATGTVPRRVPVRKIVGPRPDPPIMLKPAGSFPIALMAMPLICRPACSRCGAVPALPWSFAGAVHGGGREPGWGASQHCS